MTPIGSLCHTDESVIMGKCLKDCQHKGLEDQVTHPSLFYIYHMDVMYPIVIVEYRLFYIERHSAADDNKHGRLRILGARPLPPLPRTLFPGLYALSSMHFM